jgi:hypothetical protein
MEEPMKQKKNSSSKKWFWESVVGGGIMVIGLLVLLFINKEYQLSLTHIHGIGYTKDGNQIMIPAHDGIQILENGKWSLLKGEKHDYMGFSLVDNGFYSSGHSAPGSKLKNPLGIVKSTDGGNSLQPLDLYGIEDFHGLTVGYYSHVIYVLNPKPNPKMGATGLYYSTDDAKTWNQSAFQGVNGQAVTFAAHPTDPATVLIGTNKGLFQSKDFGNSFTKLSIDIPVSSLSYNPKTGMLIGSSGSTLFAQSGQEFQKITSPKIMQGDSISYIAQNPVKKDEIVLATENRDVFVSKDLGQTWSEIVKNGKGF